MGRDSYVNARGQTAYVDLCGDPEDSDYWDWAYDDLVESIRNCLTTAWHPVAGQWYNQQSRIIARDDLHDIWLTPDNGGRIHITFGVLDRFGETRTLAWFWLDARADAFFDALQRTFPLHIRTTPWTSASREMGKIAA